MDDSLPLRGKVALVVGAGRPLGRLAALTLAQSGVALALHDLSPVHLDETAAAVTALGVEQHSYTGDVGKGLPCRALISDVLENCQRLDILVTCLQASPASDLLELDEWDWTRTLELNLTAPFLLAQAAVPVMIEQGGGTLIFFQAIPSPDSSLALAASQSGLTGLAQTLSRQLITDHIGVFTLPVNAVNIAGEIDPESAARLQVEIVRCCTSSAVIPVGKGDS